MENRLDQNISDNISSLPVLPTTRANILHILGSKKMHDYTLSPDYKGIKISPKTLYALQSVQSGFNRSFGEGHKQLKITNGKIILTDLQKIQQDFITSPDDEKYIISSCIENPVSLRNPNQKPNYRQHVKHDGKNYFFVSFKYDAIGGYDQEDFIVVSYQDIEGLQVQKIKRIEYASGRKAEIIDVDGVPTLKIMYGNPDAPGGVYEEGEYRDEITFDLKDLKTTTKSGFYSYRSRKTERFPI